MAAPRQHTIHPNAQSLTGLFDQLSPRRKIYWIVSSWTRKRDKKSLHYTGSAIDVKYPRYIVNDRPLSITSDRDKSRYYWLGYIILLNHSFVDHGKGLGVNCAVPHDWQGEHVLRFDNRWCPHYHIHVRYPGAAYMFEGSIASNRCTYRTIEPRYNVTTYDRAYARAWDMYIACGGDRNEYLDWKTADDILRISDDRVLSPYTGKVATVQEVLRWLHEASGLAAAESRQQILTRWSLYAQIAGGAGLVYLLYHFFKKKST